MLLESRKSASGVHENKTKLMALICICKIRKAKRVWTMDETSARTGCSLAEKVIVPNSVGELSTRSPDDRTYVTVIETINAAGGFIPPFSMVPGEKLMSSRAHKNLDDNSWMTATLKGYITNEAKNEYLDHFIQYSNSGPTQQWTMLLWDGHTCPRSEEFSLKAERNNIHLQVLPSHETHALQPLDVGVFR